MLLEQVSDAIWLVEGDMVDFYSFPYPTRSVVVRFANNDLWIWSPIKLSDALRQEVNQLGPVAHLVSPNKIHHLFLQDWKAAYPAANLWGPASTIKKRPDLDFREPLTDVVPTEWKSDLDQAWFRGSRFMDEIVFLHKASRAAILADLIENFSEGFLREYWSWWQRPLAKLDGITSANPRAPLEWRLSFTNRAPAREARSKVLGWNCERVIMAHGDWQRTDGHAFLARSLAWLTN